MIKINGWELSLKYNKETNTYNILGRQGKEILYLGHYVDKDENFYQLESFKTREEARKFLKSENEKWNKKENK